MMGFQRTLSTIVVTLFMVGTASAADYYVSNTGNDGNSGNSGAPWATLQKAANSVSAGDIVYVENGTYAGFQISRDGTSSSPITFKANGNSVVINSKNPSTNDNINVEGADYVIIDGFIIEDSPRMGVRVVISTGVIVQNCDVRRSQHTGIFSGWAPQIQILNNVTSTSLDQHGIYVSNSNTPDDNPIIRGNETFGNNQNGIQINGDCWEGGDGIIEGAIVEDNIVHDNNWKGMSIISVQNSIFSNNLIYDNGILAGAGGIHFADQPNCGLPSNNNIAVNNTIVEPRIACFRMTNGSTANVLFNNICVAKSSSHTIADEVGGNNIDSGSNLELTSSSGLFVDANAKNFHLSDTSPAIGVGISSYIGHNAPSVDHEGADRPQGDAIDSGAFEHASAGGGGGGGGGGEDPVDETAPTVSITSPTGGTVTGFITISAIADDNVGVAGVQFYVDGGTIGGVDNTSPYQASVDTRNFGDGIHTLSASASDIAGNTSTSGAIAITVSNPSVGGGISAEHPRLVLTPPRLTELRANACYDNAGNLIPDCTPTEEFKVFEKWIKLCQEDEANCYNESAWNFALYFMVTGDQSYADEAIRLVDNNISNGMDGERKNYFLYSRDFAREAAFIYDWLHDQLSATKKATYIDYMNRICQEIYVEDPYNNPFYEHARWAVNDPGNNYYYSQLLCPTFTAIATYGENPNTVLLNGTPVPLALYHKTTGESFSDPLEYVYAKLDDQSIPNWIKKHGSGGAWHEGNQYDTGAKTRMFKLWMHLRDAGGRDYFSENTFDEESVINFFYAMQPGNSVIHPGGDAGRDKHFKTSPYQRNNMQIMTRVLMGDIYSEYAKHWVQEVMPTMPGGWSFMKPYSFLWDSPNLPQRDYRELPLSHFASGVGWMNSRSSWDSDAVSVSFTCSERIQDHQHKDQNSFVIYRGTGEPGWQAIDANYCPGSNGLSKETSYHNTIKIDGEGQRFGTGTGTVTKYTATDEYVYVAGDASDAYYTDPRGWGPGKEKMIDVFQRELVHILPGYIVVFDRVTPTAAFSGAKVEYLLNLPVTPTINGNETVSTSGGSKFFHRTLLPENISRATDTSRCYRTQISPATQTSQTFFLNTMYVDHDGVTAMPEHILLRSESDNMVGVQIKDAGYARVIMFSNDPTGSAPPATQFEFGALLNTPVLLFNLLPDTGYDVDITYENGKVQVAVSEGGDTYTNDAGVLSFDVDYSFGDPPRQLALR